MWFLILMLSGYDQCRRSHGACQEVGIQAVGNILCYLEKEKENKRTGWFYLDGNERKAGYRK